MGSKQTNIYKAPLWYPEGIWTTRQIVEGFNTLSMYVWPWDIFCIQKYLKAKNLEQVVMGLQSGQAPNGR